MNSIYRNACYLDSVHNLSQLPADIGIELAFAGRSNAGKSSALNCISENKSLARVSRTPGRTQAINYFRVAENKHLVDLPGYGYAKVPSKMRRHWESTLERYFAERQALQGLFMIMDIRHPLQKLDWQMISWCTNAELKLHILLTKADKLSRNNSQKTLFETLKTLEKANIEASLQLFSAKNALGVEDVHSVLDEWFEL